MRVTDSFQISAVTEKQAGLNDPHCVAAAPQKCAALRDYFFCLLQLAEVSVSYYLET